MKVLPECVVNFAQLRRVSRLGQVTSKHQSGLTWGPPPSPWPLSKFLSTCFQITFSFFRNILLRFITSVFHNHSSNVKSFFSLIPYNGPFQIVATLVLWSMHPSLLEKPFLEWLDPAISWESFFFQIWHRAPGAIMIMQKEKRNQAFCALTTGISQSIWFAQ